MTNLVNQTFPYFPTPCIAIEKPKTDEEEKNFHHKILFSLKKLDVTVAFFRTPSCSYFEFFPQRLFLTKRIYLDEKWKHSYWRSSFFLPRRKKKKFFFFNSNFGEFESFLLASPFDHRFFNLSNTAVCDRLNSFETPFVFGVFVVSNKIIIFGEKLLKFFTRENFFLDRFFSNFSSSNFFDDNQNVSLELSLINSRKKMLFGETFGCKYHLRSGKNKKILFYFFLISTFFFFFFFLF